MDVLDMSHQLFPGGTVVGLVIHSSGFPQSLVHNCLAADNVLASYTQMALPRPVSLASDAGLASPRQPQRRGSSP